MAKLVKTQVTKHQRGFFGRVWQIVFWLFQAAMVAFVVANLNTVGDVSSDCVTQNADALNASACKTGAAIGGGIVAVTGWFLWFLGTVLLAVLMFATRGKLVTYDVVK
ncbi:MAG: hypothetical protein JWS10_4251 [Cypionkella sp.]|uniref:hypothetical protein n=1 Tax=Cypionkella sp. TaxID=2811411 RepID=UPI002639C32D|nr:hypothetical protein [Cypionkella sp.]MDB5661636.1 hypothetical protein [Cypionkella sp.]